MANKRRCGNDRYSMAIALGSLTSLAEDGANFGDDLIDCN